MTPEEREQRAMLRFNILNLSRFAAIAFVILGAVLISGKYFPAAPPALGYTVFVIGVIDFFLMPFILRRMWAQKDGDTDQNQQQQSDRGAARGDDDIVK